MPYPYVGGLRDGKMSSEEDLPDEAVNELLPNIVRAPVGRAREVYQLKNGQLQYVMTIPARPWRQNGDACPVCEQLATRMIGQTRINDGQYREVGSGELKELNPRMAAVISCTACGSRNVVDPSAP